MFKKIILLKNLDSNFQFESKKLILYSNSKFQSIILFFGKLLMEGTMWIISLFNPFHIYF